jgi:CheY-like chemotaxis protein
VKILLIDDDAVSREHLSSILIGMDHEIRAHGDGIEAWKAFDAEPVRVVISDWEMPGIDGPTLCGMIRSRPDTEYVYFILVTGVHITDANCNRAIAADVDDFLVKPVDRFAIWRRLHVAKRILNFSTEMNRLKLLLPICTYCKKIRGDGGQWQDIEDYIKVHTGTCFSHGVCPDCTRRMVDGETRGSDEIG